MFFTFHSTVQEFIATHELILAEMRILANNSEFAESEASNCNSKLKGYLELTNRFMDLVWLVSSDDYIGNVENISTAIDDFLASLHRYQVSGRPRFIYIVFLL